MRLTGYTGMGISFEQGQGLGSRWWPRGGAVPGQGREDRPPSGPGMVEDV